MMMRMLKIKKAVTQWVMRGLMEAMEKMKRLVISPKTKAMMETPLTCTYHRGKRDVFVASKRQRAISSPAIKPKDKAKGNMERSEP